MARSRRPRPDDCDHRNVDRSGGTCVDCGEDVRDYRTGDR